MATTRVPILTYHGNNINGLEYTNNDLVAFQADLQLIDAIGWRIITMDQLLAWYAGQLPDEAVKQAVVLTCDDGTWFDYHDLDHPSYGPQKSLFTLLKNHQLATGKQVHMTNFVIVSPEARKRLDQLCLVGRGWWGDDWWQSAQQSGLMSIANHSWDHNHGVLDNNNHSDDSFADIADEASCDQQIKQAQLYLQEKMGIGFNCPYFAYPYGNYSDYLHQKYLPQKARELGLMAAFTTRKDLVSRDTDRWAMPRLVCNYHWNSTTQLADLLQGK